MKQSKELDTYQTAGYIFVHYFQSEHLVYFFKGRCQSTKWFILERNAEKNASCFQNRLNNRLILTKKNRDYDFFSIIEQPYPASFRTTNGGKRTGFLGSSTSRMLRFSRGMMPRGSLSYRTETRLVQLHDVHAFSSSVQLYIPQPSAFVGHTAPLHRDTHRGVLKVVEAVVREDEPSPFPGLHPAP